MKKLVLSIMLVLATGVCMAQSSLVVTLTHNGNVTDFYGPNALNSAHSAAVDGDVITLSGGTFQSTDITKGITVRGAGMLSNNDSYSTIVSGDLNINVPDSLRLNVEGIQFNDNVILENLVNSQFLDCYFSEMNNTAKKSFKTVGCIFVHCLIKNLALLGNNSFLACVVRLSNNNSLLSYEFTNCVVLPSNRNSGSSAYLDYSTLKNCVILYGTPGFQTLNPSKSSIAYNCVCVGKPTDLFSYQNNKTNRTVSKYEDVFKSVRSAAFAIEETYELTDSAATVFLGADGTQVGIHGGRLPFSSDPNYPHITKFEVAKKTDADGKLKVKIEVQPGK